MKEILEWKPSCINEKHGDGRAKQTIQWIDANGDSPLIAIIRAHVGEDRQAEGAAVILHGQFRFQLFNVYV